jgi:hypothetical protein
VSEIERNGKMFREILARESRIVHAWVPLIGARVKEKQLENARRETRIALNEIFRRGEDLGYLAPLFEIEVVAALELYIGRPIGRSLSLAGNPERAPESVALLCGRDNSNVIPFPVMTRLEQRKPRRIVPFSLIDAEEAA